LVRIVDWIDGMTHPRLTVKPAIAALLAGTVSVVALAAPANALNPPVDRHPSYAVAGSVRGSVVSVTPVARMTAAELTEYVRSIGMRVPDSAYGVVAYRVVYRTITPQGKPTTASGLVAFPSGRHGRLRLVEFLHGTNATRNTTASVLHTSPDRARTFMFAGSGFAVAAPDYLGLGVGPGRHPYGDTDSETSASVDLLLATRQIAARQGVWLRRGVDVTGFSQGGRTTLSVSRALQRGDVPGFSVHAVAPVAGPYDIRGVEIPALLDGRVTPFIATLYLGYFITSWHRIAPLYNDPSEAFQQPYAPIVDSLFDGEHTFEQIAAALPGTPGELLTPEFAERLEHPSGDLLRRLEYADQICKDWVPRVPVRMYAGSADRDVPAQNAESCRRSLDRDSAEVSIVDVGPYDHNTSGLVAYPQILRWFADLG
jgi:pimeloyl-ACP methyl ester carboxylesterase